MKALLLIASVFLFTACGNTSSSGSNLGTGPVNFVFANQGDASTGQNLYTKITFTSNQNVSLPYTGIVTSYDARNTFPNLIVTLNGNYMCTYVWTGYSWTATRNCTYSAGVKSGDKLMVTGMPPGQVVTIPATIF